MKELNILMVCGLGLGSSFACQMSVEDVLRSLGVKAHLEHCDISSAASLKADIIITAENFRRQFTKLQIDETKTKLIFVRNLVNKQELKEHLVPVLKNTGILDSSHDNE